MSVSNSPAEETFPTRGQPARRAETRRRLVRAGTEVFAEEGLHSATSVTIARRAGVATGTFYLHFPDKHALFEEIVAAAMAELRERQERAAAAWPAGTDELRGFLHVLAEFAEEKRDLIRVAFERGGENAEIAGRIHDDVAERIESSLRRRARNEALPIHPAAAAQARAATLIRVIAWWAEDPARATRDEIVDTLYYLAPTRLVRAAADRTAH